MTSGAIDEAELRARFNRRPLAVMVLLGLCLVVLLLMHARPNPLWIPGVDVAEAFGAQENGSLLAHREYWRLFSAAFVHFGWIHLLFNGYALWIIGSFQERFFGAGRFLFIYCGAALAGNLATLWLLSNGMPSAGASGAVFGLLGAQLVVERLHTLPESWRRPWWKGVLPWILLNLALGFGVNWYQGMHADSGGDAIALNNYAHVGGLLGGALLTWGIRGQGTTRQPDAVSLMGYLLGLIALGCCLMGIYHGYTSDPEYILFGHPL